jgi:agmatine/peptidylarginine deiminase
MYKLIISVLILLSTISVESQGRKIGKREPDFDKILEGASENFNKALKEGKTQKISDSKFTDKNVKVLDYKDLPNDLRVPAQFEEVQAVAMTWIYDGSSNLDASSKISADLANAIQQNAKVVIRIQKASDAVAIEDIMTKRGTPLKNYTFYVQPINDWWDRDSGPISFYYGSNDDIGFIDMDYTTLEAVIDEKGNILTDYNAINKNARTKDDGIPVALGKKFNYPVYHTRLNNEGGNFITDGLQTMWSSAGTRSKNLKVQSEAGKKYYTNYPSLSDADFTTLYMDSYKAKSFVEPIRFTCDGGTGHLDIYSKLINESNLAIVDYAKANQHTDFDSWNKNLLKFKGLKDPFGNPLTIHLLPMPLTSSGQVQVKCLEDQRTYINGVYVNKAFIMPIFSDPANPSKSDADAIKAVQKEMAGYKIQPININAMYGLGGAIHCITMQIPAENPIFIRHNAISGSQPLQTEYNINAYIKNKSGLASQNVFYKKSTETSWKSLPLVSTGSDNYTAKISGSGLAIGDIIEYFIEAKSNNGKTISKPFVAREGGANTFKIGSKTLGINEFDASTNFALSLYPNPAKKAFTLPISLNQSRKVSIEIVDVLGRIVYTKKQELTSGLHLNVIENSSIINNKGIYIVKVTADSVLISNQRLVIE